MPQLNNLLENRKKSKFVKKNYRPWDLTGDKQELELNNQTTKKDSAGKQKKRKAIDNGKVTNREQSDNGKVTNREQSDNGKVTNREQSDNGKVTNREQLDNKLDNKSINKNHSLDLNNLSGIQRKIMDFLSHLCLMQQSKKTGPIETYKLVEFTAASYGSIKMSIIRLIKKGFLIRNPGKTAKGGYINFSIPSAILDNFSNYKNDIRQVKSFIDNISLTKNKLGNALDNNCSVYSSSNNINTTTKKEIVLDDEKWGSIDITPLSCINFSINHINQLTKNSTPEIVQESIFHFAYGLEHNSKVKAYNNPLNVFMGVLIKGKAWTEPNYESPKDRVLRELLERKKAEKDKRDQMVKELVDLEFPDWEKTLTTAEKKRIAPPDKALNTSWDNSPEKLLRDYFAEEVLSKRLEGEDVQT